jgi:hypothetical protein
MQMEMEKGGKLFFDLFVAMCNHMVCIVLSDGFCMNGADFCLLLRMISPLLSLLLPSSHSDVCRLIIPFQSRPVVAPFHHTLPYFLLPAVVYSNLVSCLFYQKRDFSLTGSIHSNPYMQSFRSMGCQSIDALVHSLTCKSYKMM